MKKIMELMRQRHRRRHDRQNIDYMQRIVSDVMNFIFHCCVYLKFEPYNQKFYVCLFPFLFFIFINKNMHWLVSCEQPSKEKSGSDQSQLSQSVMMYKVVVKKVRQNKSELNVSFCNFYNQIRKINGQVKCSIHKSFLRL